MNKLLSPFVRFPGHNIGWSAQERENVKAKMYAMMQVFGPANWFITMSPTMKDNWLAQKFIERKTCDMTDSGRDFEEWTPNNDETKRNMLKAKNPVECARVYDSLSRE